MSLCCLIVQKFLLRDITTSYSIDSCWVCLKSSAWPISWIELIHLDAQIIILLKLIKHTYYQSGLLAASSNTWNTNKYSKISTVNFNGQQKKVFFGFHISFQFFICLLISSYSVLDNIFSWAVQREVKMAGYWSIFFLRVLWTETKLRSIKTQKKERGQYPAILTEQAVSSSREQSGQSQADRSGSQSEHRIRFILPAQVANQNAGFGSSCPLAEPAI